MTQIVIMVLTIVLGLCVGSFLNVVIYRVPNNMSLAKPSSHCPKCNHKIRWFDNIPILSFLLLKGKCRDCKEVIPIRYTLVEALNAIMWLVCFLIYWKYNIAYAIISMILCSIFICIFFIDIEHQIIPDRFHIMILVLAIATMFCEVEDIEWQNKIFGMIILGGIFVILHYGSIYVLKREGLGGGDVKLATVCGLLLGWERSILALIIASVSASIILILIKIIRKDKEGKEYPFAPFIVTGVLISLFFGMYLFDWYIGLFA